VAAKAASLHSCEGAALRTAAKLNINFSCLTLVSHTLVQRQLLVVFKHIAYVTLALVTFKFHQIVRSWYSGAVIIV